MLTDFLLEKTFAADHKKVSVNVLHRMYLNYLAPAERPLWPRWKFTSKLSALHPIGTDADGVLCVGGLSVTKPEKYALDSPGRLRLAS